VYNGTNTKIAIDGAWGGSSPTDNYYKPSAATNMIIGAYPDSSAHSTMSIDELKIDNGVARWTIGTNFTPPEREYTGTSQSSIFLTPDSTENIIKDDVVYANGESVILDTKGDNVNLLKLGTTWFDIKK
jgi:hypothetical protein